MEYDSLQSFLQAHLRGEANNSKEEIDKLKKQWRRVYLKKYQKKYKEDHIQITFRLNKRQYRKLKLKAKEQYLKPTAYCRRLVTGEIDSHTNPDLQPFKIQLLELIDTMEQYQYEGRALPIEKQLEILITMLDKLK